MYRIKQQAENLLSRQFYKEGKDRGWPGLGSEVEEICEKLNMNDVNKNCLPKSVVKKAIFDHNYCHMKKEMEEKSHKLKKIQHEDFTNVQEYFKQKSVENTRMAFHVRSRIVQAKYRKNENDLTYKNCQEGQIMSQSHCLECPAWVQQREGLVLSNILDMTTFFRKLRTERTKMDKEDV